SDAPSPRSPEPDARRDSGRHHPAAAHRTHAATLAAPAARYPPDASTGAATADAATTATSDTTSDRPASRAHDPAAPTRSSSSYTSACNVPERSADPAPHRTKPAANAGYDGASTHNPKPAPASRGEATNRNRRETTSAHTPDGSSNANAVTDQITN